MQRNLITVAACGLIAACSSVPEKPGNVIAPPVIAKSPEPVRQSAVAETGPAVATETESQRLGRILQAIAGKSVYFNFDDYAIRPEYQEVIRRNADLLKAAANLQVQLEGNADEHGSREYNLALGQKRAEAVKRALEMHGVPGSGIEAVSNGEEKPRAACHEERCWAENRRVDFAPRTSGAQVSIRVR